MVVLDILSSATLSDGQLGSDTVLSISWSKWPTDLYKGLERVTPKIKLSF